LNDHEDSSEPPAKRRAKRDREQHAVAYQLLQLLVERLGGKDGAASSSSHSNTIEELKLVHAKIEELLHSNQLDQELALKAIRLADDEALRQKMLALPTALFLLWIKSQ
jgi:hypothetical protein